MFGEQMVAGIKVNKARTIARRARAIVLLICLAFAAWAGFSRIGEYIYAETIYETETVVVRQGDTLWSIAREHGPQGWDLRKTVDVMRDLNSLTAAELGNLQSGHEIRVPVR